MTERTPELSEAIRRMEENLRVCLREIQEDLRDVIERVSVLERATLQSSVPLAPRGSRPENREEFRLVYLARPPGMDGLHAGLERSIGTRVNELLPPSHRVTVVPMRRRSQSTIVRPIEAPTLRSSTPSLSSSDSPRRTNARAIQQPRPSTLHGSLPVPVSALPAPPTLPVPTTSPPLPTPLTLPTPPTLSTSQAPSRHNEKVAILILYLLPIPDTPPSAADIADLIRLGEKEDVPGLVLVARFSTEVGLTTAIRESAFGPRVLQLVIRTGRGLVHTDPITRDGLQALAAWLLAH